MRTLNVWLLMQWEQRVGIALVSHTEGVRKPPRALGCCMAAGQPPQRQAQVEGIQRASVVPMVRNLQLVLTSYL